jgi:hypothetical protein
LDRQPSQLAWLAASYFRLELCHKGVRDNADCRADATPERLSLRRSKIEDRAKEKSPA